MLPSIFDIFVWKLKTSNPFQRLGLKYAGPTHRYVLNVHHKCIDVIKRLRTSLHIRVLELWLLMWEVKATQRRQQRTQLFTSLDFMLVFILHVLSSHIQLSEWTTYYNCNSFTSRKKIKGVKSALGDIMNILTSLTFVLQWVTQLVMLIPCQGSRSFSFLQLAREAANCSLKACSRSRRRRTSCKAKFQVRNQVQRLWQFEKMHLIIL